MKDFHELSDKKGLVICHKSQLFCIQSLGETKNVCVVEILLNLCKDQYQLEFTPSTDNVCLVEVA